MLGSVQILSYHGPGAAAGPRAWVADTRAALARHGAEGAYSNYADRSLRDWRRQYYGANGDRLREVKRRVDPDGRFRFAQAAGT